MEENNSGSSQSIDVDSVLSSIDDSPSSERAMSDTPPEQTPQQTTPEYEFTWNGKKIKAPVDKLTQWASQGYDYGQKMAEFNRRQAEFQNQSKQVDEIKSKYSEIDEYVKQNPDWWQHVTQTWEQRTKNLGQDPNNIRDLAKTYAEEAIKPIKDQIAQREQQELFQKQDQELDSQIKSVREQYTDIDFDAVGDDGKTLLYKVLEFGATKNISDFDIAFKAFNHDTLIKRAERRALESQSKEVQKRTKLGILGTSSTPTRTTQDATNYKQKSYNDLTKEALEELGIR